MLIKRSLFYYWRTNLAVIAGVAIAVAVLAGALVVGDSVRESLRDLVLQRLGRTDDVVFSTGFFRENLAEELRADRAFGGSFDAACPMIVLEGVVTQNLIQKQGSPGRVLAIEVMIPNAAIRNLIREDKVHQIYSAMQVGQAKFGMQTFNQSLAALVQRGVVTLEEAVARSSDPDELRNMMTSGPRTTATRPSMTPRP